MIWPKAVIRLTAVFLLVFAGYIVLQTGSFSRRLPLIGSGDRDTSTSGTEFWDAFQAILASAAPDCQPPERRGSAKALGFDQFTASNEPPRPECLSMSEEGIQTMRETHQRFVQAIEANSPNMKYVPGSRGLVSSAGGDYLPLLVISLRMVRRTGCQLPMEVFLSSEQEWESQICELVLPQLNARCILLSTHLGASADSLTRFQFKSLSMLFSSFEELLFTDADSWPVRDPSEVFDSEPFLSKQLVTFPDYWASSISHIYYDITGQAIPRLSERQSTESGEMFLSKKRHERTLLLSTYYNYFGPKYYYPLLSQGAPGEGDKDTFLAAASVLNETYYAVRQGVRSIGHWSEEKRKVIGSAMVQFDPVEDFRIHAQGNSTEPASSPKPFFVHNNFPRLNPRSVWSEHPDIILDNNGKFRRPWTAKQETLDAFDFDFQQRYWEEIMWTACELEDKFKSWQGFSNICTNTKTYFDSVFGPS